MPIATTVRTISIDEAERRVQQGAAYLDPRSVSDYLDVHVPGSISLQWEFGPGMQQRARDCIPLEVPLIVLQDGATDPSRIAAALRGKGFAVVGTVEDGLRTWAKLGATPASTEIHDRSEAPGGTVVDVGDPGVRRFDDAVLVSVEKLWSQASRLAERAPLAILAGRGVRAAMAVGMLERAGVRDLVFWRRP